MTQEIYTKYQPVEVKKPITIRLSENLLDALEIYLEKAKKIDKNWNRSRLIDAILFDYMLSNDIISNIEVSNKLDL